MAEAFRAVEAMMARTVSLASYTGSRSDTLYRSDTVKRPKEYGRVMDLASECGGPLGPSSVKAGH